MPEWSRCRRLRQAHRRREWRAGQRLVVLGCGRRLWQLQRREESRRRMARRSKDGSQRGLRSDAGNKPSRIEQCARPVDGGAGIRRIFPQASFARPYPKDEVEPQGLSSDPREQRSRECGSRTRCQHALSICALNPRSGRWLAVRLFLFELSQPKQLDSILTIKEATAKPMNDRSV